MHPHVATAERVARIVLPELSGKPLYIIAPQAGSIVTEAAVGDRGGMYYRGLDEALRPELEAAGLWRGPGVAIVARDCSAESNLVATVIHELIHWVDFDSLELPPRENPREAFQACVAVDAKPERVNNIPPALWGHDRPFTRLAVHAWYRCLHAASFYVRPEQIQFGSAYPTLEALSPPGRYVELLLPEAQQHWHRPLRDVLKLPLPEAFAEQWRIDLANVFDAAAKRLAA